METGSDRPAGAQHVGEKKRLLWVGDAGCPSGFARATHAILEMLHKHYEVFVLGINYRGDPHDFPYKIWAASPGGDSYGVGRLIWMCDVVRPDVIVLQNDGWNIPFYMKKLLARRPNGEYYFPEHAGIPVVASVAVDGKNFRGEWLDGVTQAVFWTQFALDEACAGGYRGPATVIPLGVDLTVYYPMDRREARACLSDEHLADAFIVGNVNRNQPRKRLDLTIRYFAEWITSKGIRDAYLYLHVAPTGDTGVDIWQLADYYGIKNRIVLVQPEVFYGLSEQDMRVTYNCFDVQVTTTQGEGFGLTTFEGMACGVPQVVPQWAALGEICEGAAWVVPCTSTTVGPPYVNVLGGVPDQAKFVAALDVLYRNPQYRSMNRTAGLERVEQPRFRWDRVGAAWVAALSERLLGAAPEDRELEVAR